MSRNLVFRDPGAIQEPKTSKSIFIMVLLVAATSITPRIAVATLEYERSLDLRYSDFLIVAILYISLIAYLTGRKLILENPIMKPLLIYVLVSGIATLFGILSGFIDTTRAVFFLLKEVEFYIVFFITLNIVRKRKDIAIVIWAILGFAPINNIYAFYQIISKDFQSSSGFSVGLIGEASRFGVGGYLSLVFLLSMCMLVYCKLRGSAKVFLVLNAIASLFSLVYTASRSFIYGTVVATLVFFAITKKKKAYILSTVVIVMVVVLAVFFWDALDPVIGERATSVSWISRSVDIRVESSYAGIIEMISERPIIGYGKSITGTGGLPVEAHNTILRLLWESGIIGLLVFAWLIYSIIRMSALTLKGGESDYNKVAASACILSTISIVVASTFQDGFTAVKVNEIYWIIIGLTAVAYRLGGYGENLANKESVSPSHG